MPVSSDRYTPVSAYRLQLRPNFGFREAAELADYLGDLGVTHVSLSPILQAAPGSVHGFDVVDHSRISADLGGQALFRTMVERFHGRRLGVIVDVVPYQMAIPMPETLNRQLWSVLKEGPGSPYARWFNVDWAAQDHKLVLPILDAPVEECLGHLIRDMLGDEPVVRYFGHVLPVRLGTEGHPIDQLLREQHYRLTEWRVAATELNWQRFLDITSLIAIRVEDREVFDETHARLLGLIAEGLIDGLQVRHPDVLADPQGYLRQLAATAKRTWIVVDKILNGSEQLPADWPCAGTTGYDTLRAISGLFIDPAASASLTGTYVRFTSGPGRFAEVAETAKRETANRTFSAEVSKLCELLAQVGGPQLAQVSMADLRMIIVQLLAAFPVYRAYVLPGEPIPGESKDIMAQAAASARRRLPWRLHPTLRAVGRLVLGLDGDSPPSLLHNELIIRFQQACGPVVAKGVEDTALYRWPRFAALNEIGCEPDRFGISPAEFHALAGHLARNWPTTLTTLSTLDTKWQEDVRCRLAVLAELPQTWAAEARCWHDRAAELTNGRLPAPDDEYLFWQVLVGTWPITAERLSGLMLKASREQKIRTSWENPRADYEERMEQFVAAVVSDQMLTEHITRFVARIAPDARVNSLGAKLVQLTMPGVPEIYQGCELTGLAFFDPDNRRPVDFDSRRRLLTALDAGDQDTLPFGHTVQETAFSAEKLHVTRCALRLRRNHADWFAEAYTPLRAHGRAARHAIAFAWGRHTVTVATRLPVALRRLGGWEKNGEKTEICELDGQWQDVLTGITHAGPSLSLSALTSQFPIALLTRVGG